MAEGGPWGLFCGCCGGGESELSSRGSVSVISGVSRKMSVGEEKQFLSDLMRVSTNTMPATPQMTPWRSEEAPQIAAQRDETGQQGPSSEGTSPTRKAQGEFKLLS